MKTDATIQAIHDAASILEGVAEALRSEARSLNAKSDPHHFAITMAGEAKTIACGRIFDAIIEAARKEAKSGQGGE